MPINPVAPRPAGIDGILKALQTVHSVYGINTEAVKQKLMDEQVTAAKSKNEQSAALSDPNSRESKLAQEEAAAGYEYLSRQKGFNGGRVTALQGMVRGTPAVGNEGEDGYTPAVPGLSAASIGSVKETSPLKDAIDIRKAELNAEAGVNRAYAITGGKLQIHAEDVANKDPEIVSATQRLNGVLRIGDILKQVQSGKLKDTTQIMNSIGNEYNKLETGANSSGLGQQERATMIKDLEADKNNLITRVTGAIEGGGISSDQWKQLIGEVDTMKKSYMEQFDQRHESLSAGLDANEKKIVDAKLGTVRGQIAKRYGYWDGLQQIGKAGTLNLGDNTAHPRDTPTAPAGAKTAVNPKTGERLILQGGQWVPMK